MSNATDRSARVAAGSSPSSPPCSPSERGAVSERDFVAAVETCTLPGAAFRHADHVRLAWIYLRDYPLLEAISRFTVTLRRFAAHHGVPGKYHATITWAYLLIIHERMQLESKPCDWEQFRSRNGDLFARNPSILERYYERETLGSDVARRIFVMPDAGVKARLPKP
jgi:hypothetical protein